MAKGKKTTKTKSLKDRTITFTVTCDPDESSDGEDMVMRDVIVEIEGDMDTEAIIRHAIEAIRNNLNSAMIVGKVKDCTICC